MKWPEIGLRRKRNEKNLAPQCWKLRPVLNYALVKDAATLIPNCICEVSGFACLEVNCSLLFWQNSDVDPTSGNFANINANISFTPSVFLPYFPYANMYL